MDFDSVKEYLPAIAGSALAALRGKKNWVTRTISFVSGLCFSLFLTAPVIEFFHLSDKWVAGTGFVLGYFGMALADGVLDSDWAGIIKARLGGGL